MAFLYWNCRGASSHATTLVLLDLVHSHRPSAFFIAEPHTASPLSHPIVHLTNLNQLFASEASGFPRSHFYPVAWKRLCTDSSHGGFGFSSLHDINRSSLVRLGRRFLLQPQSIWALVLKAKYGGSLMHKRACSPIWKGLTSISNILQQGLAWQLGNALRILFWTNIWLLNHPILFSADPSPNEHMLSQTVSHYYQPHLGWNLRLLSQFLPSSFLHLLELTVLDHSSLDVPIWRLSSNGLFFPLNLWRKSSTFLLSLNISSGVISRNPTHLLASPVFCGKLDMSAWRPRNSLLRDLSFFLIFVIFAVLSRSLISMLYGIVPLLLQFGALLFHRGAFWWQIFFSFSTISDWTDWNMNSTEWIFYKSVSIQWHISFCFFSNAIWYWRNLSIFDSPQTDSPNSVRISRICHNIILFSNCTAS